MLKHVMDELERQVLVLYILEKLTPVHNAQLILFCCENDVMNYFDLQACIGDLADLGYLFRTRKADDVLLEITPAGADVLAMYTDRVPDSVRQKVDAVANQYRERFVKENELNAYIQPGTPEEHTVVLQILGGNDMRKGKESSPILEIRLNTPGWKLANIAKERWTDCAQSIYEILINQLFGEEGVR